MTDYGIFWFYGNELRPYCSWEKFKDIEVFINIGNGITLGEDAIYFDGKELCDFVGNILVRTQVELLKASGKEIEPSIEKSLEEEEAEIEVLSKESKIAKWIVSVLLLGWAWGSYESKAYFSMILFGISGCWINPLCSGNKKQTVETIVAIIVLVIIGLWLR